MVSDVASGGAGETGRMALDLGGRKSDSIWE